MSTRGTCRKRKWVQSWLLTHLTSGIHAPAKTSLKWKWSGQGRGQNILLMLFNSCLEIQIMSHVHYWKDFQLWCLGTFIHNLFKSSKSVIVRTVATIHSFVLMGEFQHLGNVIITGEWIIRVNWPFSGPMLLTGRCSQWCLDPVNTWWVCCLATSQISFWVLVYFE